jgi:glutathione S-transferase
MKLWQIPVSNYSQKVAVAIYEKNIDCEMVLAPIWEPAFKAEFSATKHPFGKVPVLELDDGSIIPESSIIIEYLDAHFDSGTRLIPQDRDLARWARSYDRMGDLYVMDPARSVLFELRKPEEEQDKDKLKTWRHQLQTMLDTAEKRLSADYLLGDELTLADLAFSVGFVLAGAWGFAMDDRPRVQAWFDRCLARPSFQRVTAEADAFRNR